MPILKPEDKRPSHTRELGAQHRSINTASAVRTRRHLTQRRRPGTDRPANSTVRTPLGGRMHLTIYIVARVLVSSSRLVSLLVFTSSSLVLSFFFFFVFFSFVLLVPSLLVNMTSSSHFFFRFVFIVFSWSPGSPSVRSSGSPWRAPSPSSGLHGVARPKGYANLD
jgi:hypothetical protein